MSPGGLLRLLVPALIITLAIAVSAQLEITAHTRASVATSGYKIGIGSRSTGEGKPGRPLPYRTCSTRFRTCRTICPLCAATNRRGSSGCVSQRYRRSCLAQARDPKLLTI
jgi:hypothetical protein